MASVAELLAQSKAAHQRYRHASGSIKKAGNPAVQEAAISDALVTRLAAHDLDPDHTDPAWSEEQGFTHQNEDTHNVLVAFYRKWLEIPA